MDGSRCLLVILVRQSKVVLMEREEYLGRRGAMRVTFGSLYQVVWGLIRV
jgi:hypothetical protein